MLNKLSKLTVIFLVLILTACRTTTPLLTQVSQPGDQYMSCDAIITEMAEINASIREKEKYATAMIATNIILASSTVYLIYATSGIYMLTIPLPLLFMDLSDGGNQEIKSLSDRYNRLSRISNQKWCSVKS